MARGSPGTCNHGSSHARSSLCNSDYLLGFLGGVFIFPVAPLAFNNRGKYHQPPSHFNHSIVTYKMLTCIYFQWVLLMTEGILSISKENVVSKWKTHAQKVRDHWYLEVVAVSLTVAGFIVVEIAKEQRGSAHFTSWHGKFGLAGVVCAVLASFNGILTLYNVDLRKVIKPSLNKLIHILSGTLAFTFGGISLLFIVYDSHWFSGRTEENEFIKIFCFVILLVAIMWTLVRPALSIKTKVKSL